MIPKGATHKFVANNRIYYLKAQHPVGVDISPEGAPWYCWYSRSNLDEVIHISSFDIQPISLEMLMDEFIKMEEATERWRIKAQQRALKSAARAARLAEYKEAALKKGNPYYKDPRSKW